MTNIGEGASRIEYRAVVGMLEVVQQAKIMQADLVTTAGDALQNRWPMVLLFSQAGAWAEAKLLQAAGIIAGESQKQTVNERKFHENQRPQRSSGKSQKHQKRPGHFRHHTGNRAGTGGHFLHHQRISRVA
jgi:hypothetical protein